ncbi:hypothetical protein KVR01_006638 [Diaporthe batatas]|uniref:uncharacterized protein n=1 Tax=Diaporthe batatas TaxID=748121 RepID=UPI001D049387|nr:uncharacterized protein KVR01_006638 [Diaporthe batatas]KAG8163341.1 hypothetical protein KVR01_006638 [Diaporthe batatas]
MSISTTDGNILALHARRGDTSQLRQALDVLVQRQGSTGLDRANILLLARDEFGNNVAHTACTFNNTNVLEFVYELHEFALQPGVLRSILHARNNMGDQPIHLAAQNNSLDCARAIIQRGADANAVGALGFYATHFAAREGYPQMLRLLVQSGADHSPVTVGRDTPAHFAARNRDIECLKTLHEAGARLQDKNMGGETPAMIAQRLSNEEIMIWMAEQHIIRDLPGGSS